MKFISIQSNIKESISLINRVAIENINLPVLKNVLIQAENGMVTFSATNLEIAVICKVSAKVIEDGAMTVSVSTLSDLINNIKSERLNFGTKGDFLEITTDNYQATIQGASTNDFPPIIKPEKKSYLEIKGIFLKDAIRETAIASQASELRPELNTILFDFSIESLKLAAADNFRLAEKTIHSNNFSTKNQDPFKLLIPLKTCYELLRIIKDDESVAILFENNQFIAITDRIQLVSRVVEGSFPEYSQIIPRKINTEIIVQAADFFNGIKLASVFGQKNGEVRLRIDPQKKIMEITSADQGLGENQYILPAKIKGDAMEVAFNWRYLADPLKVLNIEEIFLGLQEDANPAILRPVGDISYIYITKPLLGA